MNEFLIHSKRCFINEQFVEATLHIRGHKIFEIYNGYHSIGNIELLDVRNSIVMPGIIDAHVHINEPGRTHWEGFETATKAAAFGGGLRTSTSSLSSLVFLSLMSEMPSRL